jgi:hypothetical protein
MRIGSRVKCEKQTSVPAEAKGKYTKMRPRKRYRKSNREAKLNWEVNTLKRPGEIAERVLDLYGGN